MNFILERTIIGVAVICLSFGAAWAADGHKGGSGHGGHDGHGGHGGHSGAPYGDMKAHHDEMHKALADTSAFGEKGDPRKAQRQIALIAADVKFDIEALTVKLGETLTLKVTNAGMIAHEFTIGDAAYQEMARAMMAHMAGMGMDTLSPEHVAMHEGFGNTVILAPGETKSLTWRFTKPGDFLFACNVPGHYEAGMAGKIEVR